MIGLLVLLGMAPVADRVPVGPPAPHLRSTPAVQWQLSQGSSWQAFQARWGEGWSARWDERTGAPRVLLAPGISTREASLLAHEVAALAGVDPAELVPAGDRRSVDASGRSRRIMRWSRTWQGAPVLGDEVALVATEGRIGGVWVALSPLHGLDTPRAGESVLVLPVDGRGEVALLGSTGVQAVLVRPEAEGSQVVYRDRTGAEVYRFETRRHATVEVEHLERNTGDASVSSPARGVTLTDAGGTTAVSADDGSHSLSGVLQVELTGPELVVTHKAEAITATGEDDFTLVGGTDIDQSAASVLHHFHQAWDWLEARWPEHPWLGQQVPASVELDYASCNAFYTGGTINFFVGYPGYCNNTGESADVIFHELGHGVHHYILAAGTFAGDISEGSGDFMSATLNDDPEVGRAFWADGSTLRELDTDRFYPTDAIGQVHNDGLIWGSFLWNLREQWEAADGEPGVEATDLLFLATLQQGPTMTDVYEAVLLADDDDGDLSNSTPHACELKTLLDHHGLGPGPIGVVVFAHDPIEAPGSYEETYPVDFLLQDVTQGCGDLDLDSVQLWFSTEELPAPGTPGAPLPVEDDSGTDTGADTGGDTGGDTGEDYDPYEGWTQVPLSHDGSGGWSGAITRQLPETRVRYFMQASSGDGTQTITTHGGQDDDVYAFTVGDREALWCEGFEAEPTDWTHGTGTPWMPGMEQHTDQWEVGAPGGTGLTPAEAWEGTGIVATDLDGPYLPDNRMYLQGPLVEVPAGSRMPTLAYRRWLTVEDGIYDHARVYLDGFKVWENAATSDGAVHELDTRWTLHELPLDAHLEDGQVQPTWTLSSDGGLEFGGWALDEVCVTVLADVPGHYRVRDLVASDDEDTVTISFSWPWIAPVGDGVLVKKAGAYPEHENDGLILALDQDPEPGEEVVVVDPDVQPGETWYYAAFLSDGGGDLGWVLDVVEGDNADVGGVPEEPVEPDTGTDEEEPTDRAQLGSPGVQVVIQGAPGCGGCVQGGGSMPGLAGLLAGLALLRRREES